MNRFDAHAPLGYALVVCATFSAFAAVLTTAPPALARTQCENTTSFSAWKREFRSAVARQGVSERTIQRAYDPVRFDSAILKRDRRQSFFSLSFLQFSKKLVSGYRLKTGGRKLRQRKALFDAVERKYGVPGPVIVAFWALESDFGAGLIKQYPILNSLATLAYDCRRGDMFGDELIAALKLVDTGKLPLSRMTGSWAGEIGETQFLPGHVLDHGVDGDGDGRVDLYNSDADIVHSTANFIKHLGWRANEPWLQEVRVPAQMDWAQADVAIQHPVSRWSEWGVRARDGGRLDTAGPPASLLLPMGRNGPAFLAYRNFQIYPEWNRSLNYATTAAYLATRLAGAPRYNSGRGNVTDFDYKQIMDLQRLLNQRGYDTGGVDGKHGAKSRAATKAAQIKYGLPADSYPSRALIRRLRRGG